MREQKRQYIRQNITLKWRRSELDGYSFGSVRDKLPAFKVIPDNWPNVIGCENLSQESQQLEKLCVCVVVEPALYGDTIVDLVAICVR